MSPANNDRWGMSTGWSSENESNVLDQMWYGAEHRRRQGRPFGAATQVVEASDGSIISNSENYLQTRPHQQVRSDASAKLSQTRQDYLREVSERVSQGGRPNLGMAAAVVPKLTKVASQVAASDNGRLNSTSNSSHLAPDIYSPLFLTQNIQLPRDRLTMNAWNRAFYDTNPYVRNAINLHATYPISKLNIKCEDKKVENFFLDMADRVDLQTVVQNTALELWQLGEVFNYAAFDESEGTWSQIYQLNPDYVRVKASPIATSQPSISLRPDPELQRIITSSDPEHIRIREQIDPKIIHHVLMNEFIPLDNFNASHLKFLSRAYDVRGTSIINSVWKDLMLYDKLRECKLIQADGMVNPITLIKIGQPGVDGHYPRQDEIDAWRSIFEQAQYDKDFKIVTHDAVAIERLGYTGSILDTNQDFQFLVDCILTGLMIPKSIMTQEGSSYSSASVALDVMRQRYNSFRTMMSNWLEKKIFAPISEVQEFYKLSGGKKKLIVPQIEWNQMTLFDLDTYISHITQLVGNNQVSVRTLDRSLGLNRNNELINMRQELIEKAILMKEGEALKSMTLSELRALDPEEPIVAQEESQKPLPGVSPEGAGGLMDLGGAGGGGLDLGGLPGGGGGGGLDLGPPPAIGGGGGSPLPGGPPGAGGAPTPPPAG